MAERSVSPHDVERARERHIVHRPFIVRGVVAATVVAVTALIAHRELPSWESRIFQWSQDLPDWLRYVVWAPMQLGTALAPLVVGVGAWIAWKRWRPAVGAVVVGIGGWWLAKGVKDLVNRGRPAELIGTKLRTGAPTGGLGFLSGHATVAFALATVLSPYLKPVPRVIAYGLATVVAFGRVYMAAHFPLDAVAGAALGCLLGWIWHIVVGVPESVLRTTEPRLLEHE
jgi:membrane-associated phospholipid phosphatase